MPPGWDCSLKKAEQRLAVEVAKGLDLGEGMAGSSNGQDHQGDVLSPDERFETLDRSVLAGFNSNRLAQSKRLMERAFRSRPTRAANQDDGFPFEQLDGLDHAETVGLQSAARFDGFRVFVLSVASRSY